MTRSIGAVDRIRWMTAAGAAAVMSLALMIVILASPAHLSGLSSLGSTPAAVAGQPAPAGSSAPLDPRIASLAASHPHQVVETIVQFKAGVDPDRARWDVARVAGRVTGELHIINALVVKLTPVQARELASSADVHAVSLNALIKTEGGPGGPVGPGGPQGPTLGPNGPAGPGGPGHRRRSPNPVAVKSGNLKTTYDQTLNASGLWNFGIDGSGVGVAVIDTGIDGDLPDFQSGGPYSSSRVVETAVTNPDATTAMDMYGHGTDVAGIIAGNGNNRDLSDPLYGNYIGVAPDANLISIKVSDDAGNATVLDVINGLQFAIDHQSDYNIRVVNMSLDSRSPQSYMTDPLDAAAEAAWNHGIVVVAAAGNRGSDPDAVQYAPANDPYVITVGAVDENGTYDSSDDFVPSWSSQGTTQDGFQKPDVYAPGAHIVSVLAPNSAFASMCVPCQVDGQYIRTSGTSMAAAAISGLVADLLQAHPDWSPDQVKGALTSPAVTSNSSLQEPDGVKAASLNWPPVADQGLTPNQLIDLATGGIDYTKSSWSRSTWSVATGALSAAFAKSSWSCTSCTATAAGSDDGSDDANNDDSGDSDVDSSRSTWSRSTWSTHFDPADPNG